MYIIEQITCEIEMIILKHPLQHQQIYKSIADKANGTAFFDKYKQVDEQMLRLRQIVIANKRPRKIELQHDIELVGNEEDVKYKKFEESHSGIIESQVFHYR